MDSSYVLKRLKALEETLTSTIGMLSPLEIEILLKRAERLLYESYMIKGVQSLIKNIIRSKGDKNGLLNHLVQLNLVYHLLEVKNLALGVERKVRPDSNKRVDIVVFGQRDFYIELKNVNEPELAALKESFAEKIRFPLSNLKFPYFVHVRLFRPELHKLSQENFHALVQKIKEEAVGTLPELEKGGKRGWIHYPSPKDALLSFSLEKSTLNHCSLGRYGYGENWPYCLYSEEYLEKELEKEKKILNKPFLKDETRLLHERNLKKYQLLLDNSPFLEELELKQSVLRGVRDSEMKFPTPSENALNIVLLHFDVRIPSSTADTIAGDLARWYYSLGEGNVVGELPKDRWWKYYGIWCEEEGFQREGKIDAFISLSGRGIEEPYSWKIVYARHGETELERFLLH